MQAEVAGAGRLSNQTEPLNWLYLFMQMLRKLFFFISYDFYIQL
jgi:hypothetical protein